MSVLNTTDAFVTSVEIRFVSVCKQHEVMLVIITRKMNSIRQLNHVLPNKMYFSKHVPVSSGLITNIMKFSRDGVV